MTDTAEALAEIWAGKLGTMDGTYQGYVAEASEMIERLHAMGFDVIKSSAAMRRRDQ
jgi:hypothetical protein